MNNALSAQTLVMTKYCKCIKCLQEPHCLASWPPGCTVLQHTVAHGFLGYFSCTGSTESCCFQDMGAAVWVTVFPAAVPVCSEAGSPNSAGKERSTVSTHSSRQTFLQRLTPSHPHAEFNLWAQGGYPISMDLCKSAARYTLRGNQTAQ